MLVKKVNRKKIDILLVVNMFLTGFDNKFLNTLYLDKNLKYHGLIQAFSRTNRIYNEKKMHGNIVSFRNLKKRTDEAVALFSDEDANGFIVTLPYDGYVSEFNKGLEALFKLVPDVFDVDDLEDENDIKEFVLIFRNLLRILNRMFTFVEFRYSDLNISEQKWNDYKSKYLDLYERFRVFNDAEKVSILDDVDFEIELMRRDNINVSYIINLLKDLDPNKPKEFNKDVKFIQDLIATSHELKSKAELIDRFIHENIVESGGNIDIDEELPKFFDHEKSKEIKELSKNEHLSEDKVRDIIGEYEYSGKFYNDSIKESFNEDLGFLERRNKVNLLKEKIVDLVDKFALI